MAERRPFRVEDKPVTTPKSAENKAAPSPGKGIVEAQRTGERLATPSAQTVEGIAHGHSPQIPWPKDKPVDHRPFKNTK